jgi:hypothetical protein
MDAPVHAAPPAPAAARTAPRRNAARRVSAGHAAERPQWRANETIFL